MDEVAFVEEAAVEGEELEVGAFGGGDDAEVGEFFAAGGVAFAGEGAGVLGVDVVGAGGLGAVLVGGDAGHDVGGGKLLGGRGGGEEQEEQGCGEAHVGLYAGGGGKFRGAW